MNVNILNQFWNEYQESIVCNDFKQFKNKVENDKELKDLFIGLDKYDSHYISLKDGLDEHINFFSGLELKINKKSIVEENRTAELLEICSKILMNISLIEGKFKEVTIKSVATFGCFDNLVVLQKKIISNTMGENLAIIKECCPEFHEVLKKIKFYSIVVSKFGEGIRNDFGHGKVHFFVYAENEDEIIKRLLSLNDLLITLSKYIHALSNHIVDSIGIKQLTPYYPLSKLINNKSVTCKYAYTRFYISRHLEI